MPTPDRPVPPRAERRPATIVAHGTSRTDEYAWLRADNWQDVIRDPSLLAADIRAHLDAENAYTAAVMQPTDDLQRRLFEEMKGRIAEDDVSVPVPDGAWEYVHLFRTGNQYPKLARRPRGAGAASDVVYFDGDVEAAGHAYFNAGSVLHTDDHARFAYAVDTLGSEFYDVRIREFDGSTRYHDVLTETTGDIVWDGAGEHLFYTSFDRNHRPYRVCRHRLGTPQSDDVVVFEESDHGFFVAIGRTQDRRFIVISTADHVTSEEHLIDAGRPDSMPVLVAAREAGVEYRVHSQGGRLVILTNADGAEDFKIVEATPAAPGRAHWTDLVPHVPGRLIDSIVCFEGEIVRLERESGLPRLVVRHADGREHVIAFDEAAYSLGLHRGLEFDTTELRFSYSSLTTPEQVYDYDMRTRSRTLRKQQRVPSGHDPSQYRSARVFATSHDGEQVPISLLWHETTPMDGTAPLMLYGYGAYGITIPAAFSTTRLSLVDRGFIWALAHIRGGKDKGYRWYRRGRVLEKKNTFLDFIAAAEHLSGGESPVCRRGEVSIEGGSAGGMLVGAVLNMRPDLFRAAVAYVPFVDVLNTICDGELPLTPVEWPEWGNPIVSREVFEYIRSYSPYDNVAAQAYPAMLVTAGLTDPRVTYWEPAKWVARLRAFKTDSHPLLLRTYMEAGHAGKSGRFERLHEHALHYAFVLLANDRLSATTPPRTPARTRETPTPPGPPD